MSVLPYTCCRVPFHAIGLSYAQCSQPSQTCVSSFVLTVPAMMQDLVTHAKAQAQQDRCQIAPVLSVRKILMGAGATSSQLLVR